MKRSLTIIAILSWITLIVPMFAVRGVVVEQTPPPAGVILFSSVPIPRGAYQKVETRVAFSSSEKIYARIFLKEIIGDIRNNEFGFVDLWIDERFVRRMTFSNRDLTRSQSEFQLFIHNTGQDDFTGSPLKTLEQGEHVIRLDVGRIYNREQPITRYGGGGAPLLWKVHLAEGRFALKLR